jgi:hypothetical protein
MPVRKNYLTHAVKHVPSTSGLDRTEQCCGVCLSTLTSRGSTPFTPLSFLWMPSTGDQSFSHQRFSIGQNELR